MDSVEEQEPQYNSEDIASALDEVYEDLLDGNHAIVMKARRLAQHVDELKDLHYDQLQRLDEIIALTLKGAELVSSSVGDVLAGEWGILRDEEEQREEGEEGVTEEV